MFTTKFNFSHEITRGNMKFFDLAKVESCSEMLFLVLLPVISILNRSLFRKPFSVPMRTFLFESHEVIFIYIRMHARSEANIKMQITEFPARVSQPKRDLKEVQGMQTFHKCFRNTVFCPVRVMTLLALFVES